MTEDELDRLRRNNALLGEQVRRLMHTEQRLNRTRDALEQQLERIELLNDLALRATAAPTAAAALQAGLDLLLQVFPYDQGVAFVATPEETIPRLIHIVDLVYRHPDASPDEIELKVREGCSEDDEGRAVVQLLWPEAD